MFEEHKQVQLAFVFQKYYFVYITVPGVAKLASRLSIIFIARSKLRYSGKLCENTFEHCYKQYYILNKKPTRKIERVLNNPITNISYLSNTIFLVALYSPTFTLTIYVPADTDPASHTRLWYPAV